MRSVLELLGDAVARPRSFVVRPILVPSAGAWMMGPEMGTPPSVTVAPGWKAARFGGYGYPGVAGRKPCIIFRTASTACINAHTAVLSFKSLSDAQLD